MEIKKCPFCGRASNIEDRSYPCPTDGCLLNGFAVEPEHFVLWNKRPIEDALKKENKQLTDKLLRERLKWTNSLN